MDKNRYALVLTGSVMHGYAAEAVWPALAAFFRMERTKLDDMLRRAPLSIKQGDDLVKLQTLQSGIAGLGAETELCAPDARPDLFVLVDNVPRGPLPHLFVEQRIADGAWTDQIRVAEVGSQTWVPFHDLASSTMPFGATQPPIVGGTDAGATRVSAPLTLQELDPEDRTSDPILLPPGRAIHAGFWRRCAAFIIDGLIIGIAVTVLQMTLGLGSISNLSLERPAALLGLIALTGVMAFLGQWLYFAFFESAAAQATPGKMALGLKVVDSEGRRIGFGRASARFFGKILSGMVLNVGYMLAGWTARKQALHDLLANTLVVFREVEPDAPLPTARPPMPWYGWLLNALPVLVVCAAAVTAGAMGGLAIEMLERIKR